MEDVTQATAMEGYHGSNMALDTALSTSNGSSKEMEDVMSARMGGAIQDNVMEGYHGPNMVLDTALSISNGPSKARDQHLKQKNMNHNEKDKKYTYLNTEIERDHNDETNETKKN